MLVRVSILESDKDFITSDFLLRWSCGDLPALSLTPVEADLVLTEPAPSPPARLGAAPQAWATDEGLWWPVHLGGDSEP